MSPLAEDRLAAIGDLLNNQQPISIEDSQFLLLSVDRLQSMLAHRVQEVERLKAEVERLRGERRE